MAPQAPERQRPRVLLAVDCPPEIVALLQDEVAEAPGLQLAFGSAAAATKVRPGLSRVGRGSGEPRSAPASPSALPLLQPCPPPLVHGCVFCRGVPTQALEDSASGAAVSDKDGLPCPAVVVAVVVTSLRALPIRALAALADHRPHLPYCICLAAGDREVRRVANECDARGERGLLTVTR